MPYNKTEASRKFRSTKKGYLKNLLSVTKGRAKRKSVDFDLDYEHLESIVTDRCPIFDIEFVWAQQQTGHGPKHNSPSLDRVVPEFGYVKGNVVFISHVANSIKQNVTEKELYAVADWLHDKRKEVLHAFKDRHTPVPGACDTPGRKVKTHGPVHGTGPREDCDGAHHSQGECFGADVSHCA